MTNEQNSFTPFFEAPQTNPNIDFKEIKSAKNKADDFNEINGNQQKNLYIKALEQGGDSLSRLVDDIDDLLNDVTLSAVPSSLNEHPHIDHTALAMDALTDHGNEALTDLFSDSETDAVLSDELREEIFAEGYMHGMKEQKELMERRIDELRSTLDKLTVAATTSERLSAEINNTIEGLISEVAKSVLSAVKTDLLFEVVESRVQAFTNEVEAWDLKVNVYCAQSAFNNLLEILGHDDMLDSGMASTRGARFEHNNICYVLDQHMTGGSFRLELDKADEGKIEATMDLDAHLAKIEGLLGDSFD